MGLMYVSQDFREGEPIEYNWMNRHGSDNMSKLTDYVDEYRPGARRFDVGQSSNFLNMPIAIEALRQILAWGVHNIAASLETLVDHAASCSESIGLSSIPKPFRSPHMLGISMDGIDSAMVMSELKANNIFASARGRVLRISPHLFCDLRDIEHFIDVLAVSIRRERNKPSLISSNKGQMVQIEVGAVI